MGAGDMSHAYPADIPHSISVRLPGVPIGAFCWEFDAFLVAEGRPRRSPARRTHPVRPRLRGRLRAAVVSQMPREQVQPASLVAEG